MNRSRCVVVYLVNANLGTGIARTIEEFGAEFTPPINERRF